MTYLDSAGNPLHLGPLLGKGGEGAVYDLAGPGPPRVAKLYHQPPPASKGEKLRAMVATAEPALLTIAAWPLDTVHTSAGALAGLIMPKVTGYSELHLLYSPAHRRSEFPSADWGHLVQTARNLAAAVEAVHARGHVIGDVNQKNFTVAPNATVMLVDCDSFQIAGNGTVHPCEVGVAHFTPPELQGKSFRGVVRTQNHDAFGLAVLCFHLLFMGRHPFAGRFRGRGDMPIERAISEFRFSFGASAARALMEPPPGALPLSGISPAVASLFEEAFGSTTANVRPSPGQWRAALEAMARQLRTCSRVAAHKFVSSSCVWCDLEGRTGVIFFLGASARAAGGAGAVFDVAAAWKAIENMKPPATLPPLPQPTVQGIVANPVDRAVLLRRRVTRLARMIVPPVAALLIFSIAMPTVLMVILIAIAVCVFLVPVPGAEEAVQRRAAFGAADAAWREIQEAWMRERQSGFGAFGAELDQLSRKRAAYQELERQRARELGALEAAKRQKQLDRFLDRFFIDHAKIPKIGPGRKATLASWGIETAADITYQRLAGVPGFGETLAASLIMWRHSLEGRFVFDPAQAIDAGEIARVEQKFLPQRRDIERVLLAGPARLAALRAQIDARRTRLHADLQSRAEEWARARADLDQFTL